MKKLIILLLLLMLIGCSPKKEDFYNLKIGDYTFVVGYDEEIQENEFINDYSFYEDEKGNKSLNYIEIYLDDVNSDIYIDEYKLDKGLKDSCLDLNGELIDDNSISCVLHKEIKDKDNVVVISNDILEDNINEIKRIEVSYK